MSVDARALVDRLRLIGVGETVPYSVLDTDLKVQTRGASRGALQTARRALLREGVRFDVVRGIGLKRMSDAEVAKSGARSIRLVRKLANRETAKLHAVSNFDTLTNEEKVQHNAALSVLGVVAHFSRPTQVRVLEAAVASAKQALPTRETVDAIRLALGDGKKAS
jgi:hypothetical protein